MNRFIFKKTVRESVKRGDLVNHSGAEIKRKNVYARHGTRDKKNLFIYRWTDLFFKTKTEKLNYLKHSRFAR